MRFSIQYRAPNDQWVIVDTREGSGLVAICRTEEEALLQVISLQEKILVNSYHPYDDSQLIT